MLYKQMIYKRDGRNFEYRIEVSALLWVGLMAEKLSGSVGLSLIAASLVYYLYKPYTYLDILLCSFGVALTAAGMLRPIHLWIFTKRDMP